MGDIIDKANEVADLYLNAALSCRTLPTANAITDCIDCGDPISAERKKAAPHATRCSECQSYIDKDKR